MVDERFVTAARYIRETNIRVLDRVWKRQLDFGTL